MIDLVKMPVTFREFLNIEGCEAEWEAYSRTWLYPCGLAIADRLANIPAGCNGVAVQWVHEHHHKEHARQDRWAIQEEVEVHEGTVTLRFSCGHL